MQIHATMPAVSDLWKLNQTEFSFSHWRWTKAKKKITRQSTIAEFTHDVQFSSATRQVMVNYLLCCRLQACHPCLSHYVKTCHAQNQKYIVYCTVISKDSDMATSNRYRKFIEVNTMHNATRMWANAQRDGRPAQHRWCPLLNETKSGWRSLLDCRAVNAAKTRKPLKFAGVPQTGKPISATSGSKFTILWGHVEDILLLNKFFSDCRYVP